MMRSVSLVVALSSLVSAASISNPAVRADTFTNPVVYEDFADNDVSKGPDGLFYFSASNMHFSPGAPLLRSADLVNWEMIGHSVPTLAFGDNYDLNGGVAYRGGTWASTMRYRESDKTWYWIGCINFYHSFVYTASSPSGPWTQSAEIPTCYYDCGLHIDDDDTMYVVHGNTNVNMAQLSVDGLSEVRTEQLFHYPTEAQGIEGNRMYKRNGTYYILNDDGGTQSTFIWKSTSPWGPWTYKLLRANTPGPLSGGGTPHQGSLIEASPDDWYFMSFTWDYPNGRIPVLAPITWGDDGFPILSTVDGKWGATYPSPLPTVETPSWTGTDSFNGTSLGPQWEWNHNPDTTKYSVENGITLSAATVTDDLYKARNTLTHRVHGELPVATIVLDFSNMADGDRCGLAAFRDWTAYIGVVRSADSYSVVMQEGLTLNSTDWSTVSTGTTVETAVVEKGRIWLRSSMDSRGDGSKLVTFQYSTDGTIFVDLGNAYTMNTDWAIFMGYRWGIFNHATTALGGSVLLESFTQT